MKHDSQIPQKPKNLLKKKKPHLFSPVKNQNNVYSNREKHTSKFDIPKKKTGVKGKSDSRKSPTNPHPPKRPNNITINSILYQWELKFVS